MLKDCFDNVYVINLEKRKDRLEHITRECRLIDLPFQTWTAIDGSNLDFEGGDLYWNKNALGLVLTTINIIKDAKAKGYKSILILEDDVVFNPKVNRVCDKYMPLIPDNWHMIFFGGMHIAPSRIFKDHIVIPEYLYCAHCYAVHERIYDYYIECLQKKDKQLDRVTTEDIQALNYCYAFAPDLAWQKEDYSNIQSQYVGKK